MLKVTRLEESKQPGVVRFGKSLGYGCLTVSIRERRWRIQRAAAYVVLIGEDDQGAPIELTEIVSGPGSLADIDWSLATLAPKLDALHGHLQAKRHAVAARDQGQHDGVGAFAARQADLKTVQRQPGFKRHANQTVVIHYQNLGQNPGQSFR